MSDQQKATEIKQTAENPNTGDQSQSLSIVERARQEREGLAKENERLEKNLKELRELETSRLLGSSAGGHINSMMSAEELEAQKAQNLANDMVRAFRRK